VNNVLTEGVILSLPGAIEGSIDGSVEGSIEGVKAPMIYG
jgi:hypothetical protein